MQANLTQRSYGAASGRAPLSLVRTLTHFSLGARRVKRSITQDNHILPAASRGTCVRQAGKQMNVSLYSDPELYEVAFGAFREPGKEVSFILDTAARLLGRPPTSFLELACGPATHAVEAARQGLSVAALDESRLMVSRAQGNARRAGVRMAVAVGDMRDCAFTLNERSQTTAPFDVIAILLGGLSHLLTSADVVSCFTGCHALLSPGGILVLELPNPQDIFSGELLNDHGAQFGGEREAGGGQLHTVVTWGAAGDRLDAAAQVLHRTIALDALWAAASAEAAEGADCAPVGNGLGWQAAGAGEFLKRLEEVVPERWFTAPELHLMAAAAGLRIVEMHGALAHGVPVDEPGAERMVVVLSRAAKQ